MTEQDLQIIAARNQFDEADLIACALDDAIYLRGPVKEVAATIRECLNILQLSKGRSQ